MKIKDRIKNIGFWVSILSAVIIILGAFGVEIADGSATEIINGVCSALVLLGVFSDPTSGIGYLDGTVKADETDKTE